MPISDELKTVYSTAPNKRYYIETLALEHPGFSGGVRYVTTLVGGFTGKLEDGVTEVFYEYLPFAAIPPSAADDASINLQVAIDNTSSELMDELESLSNAPMVPIIITYRVYLDGDPDTVQNDPPLRLDILSVVASQSTIAFTAGLTNLRGLPFPSQIYSTELFPGLAR